MRSKAFSIVLIMVLILAGCGEKGALLFPTNSIPANLASSTKVEKVVFYSERDGDAEIYSMNPDGSEQQALTDNDVDDFSPVWSPDGSKIVFESDRDDANPRFCFPNCNYNLYLMNADGSDQQRLTALPNAEWGADWSPDGKSLIFNVGSWTVENAGIYRLDIEGGEPQALLVDEYNNAAPDWSPDGQSIAFSSNRDGTLDVYVMKADGSDIRKIVDTGLNDYSPDWSPDGLQFVFYAADWPTVRQDIYTVNVDGTDLRNLTNTPREVDEAPGWSPDGSKIVFQTDRDGDFEIYSMNPDGSQPEDLSRNSGNDYGPDWGRIPQDFSSSNNLGLLAFCSTQGGKPQIFTLNLDEGDPMQITNDAYENYAPAWSPDGRQIAYYKHFSMQSWAIFIVDADGGNPRQLTPSTGLTVCSSIPHWSPDGSKIAFSFEPSSTPTCEMKQTEIAVINIDGTGFLALTDNDAVDLVGGWSPDGTKIVFSSNRDGNSEIYSMDADGSHVLRLTDNPAEDTLPSWSPEGSWITFTSDRDGNFEIYRMGIDGSDQTRLTQNPGWDYWSSWSPDGTQIVFSSGKTVNDLDVYIMNADGSGRQQVTDEPGLDFEASWTRAGYLISP